MWKQQNDNRHRHELYHTRVFANQTIGRPFHGSRPDKDDDHSRIRVSKKSEKHAYFQQKSTYLHDIRVPMWNNI